MAAWLAVLLPRFVILTAIALFATATLTYAAEHRTLQAAQRTAASAVPAAPETIAVPDVRKQAYVFAKGMLEEEGFAWQVRGPVHGYSANTVLAQHPAPGTKLIDTGAPTIQLTLVQNSGYPEKGAPEDAAPYRGTAIVLAN